MFGIDTLKQKAYEWALKVRKLYDTPVAPELQSEKQRLLERANTIRKSIEKVTGPLEAFKPLEPIAQQLGIVWLPVVILGVSAAAAAITYWSMEYDKFMVTVEMDRQLTSEGVPATQRAAIIAKTLTPPSFAEKIFNPAAFVPLGIVTAIGLYLWNSRR